MLARGSVDWPAHTGQASLAEIEAKPLEHWLRGRTVGEVIDSAAHSFGTAVAHRYLSSPEAAPLDTRFSDLKTFTDQAAKGFAALASGPVVASVLPALPATLPLAFGAMKAGIYMPINPMLSADAIAEMMTQANASVLLWPAEGDIDVLTALKQRSDGLTVLSVPAGRADMVDLFGASALTDRSIVSSGPGDVAAYVHTGGTTGLPKIAQLTHANLAFMAFLAAFGGGMRAADVIPCGMPLYHVGGLVFGGLAPVAAGARVVQLGQDGFRDSAMRSAFSALANREEATILFAPPTIAVDVVANTPAQPFKTARHWVSSAAPLPAASYHAFAEHTGLSVKEAWGLTEATLVLSFTPPYGESRVGSVGPRLPYCDLTVVDPQTLSVLAVGETGLILGRSPGLFAGYLGAVDDGFVTTANGERWLNTGDLGFLDADGYLTITGRAKDMILRGGHNIDPGPIEAGYLAQPQVNAAIAVGKPDARVGEVPIVFLTETANSVLDIETLRQAANQTISDPVARPRDIIVLEHMPVTAVGKPDRVALRREAVRFALKTLLKNARDIDVETRPGGNIAVRLHPLHDEDAAQVAALGFEILQESDTV